MAHLENNTFLGCLSPLLFEENHFVLYKIILRDLRATDRLNFSHSLYVWFTFLPEENGWTHEWLTMSVTKNYNLIHVLLLVTGNVI